VSISITPVHAALGPCTLLLSPPELRGSSLIVLALSFVAQVLVVHLCNSSNRER